MDNNRLEVIKKYIKADLVDLSMLKELTNENDSKNIMHNLLNVYSSCIIHADIKECPIDYKMLYNLKKLIYNTMEDSNNINYSHMIHKIKKIKVNLEKLKKKLEDEGLFNYNSEKIINKIYKDIYEIEDKIIDKKDENNIDNKYDLLYSLIFELKNKTYFNHTIEKYPYLINTYDENKKHIIIDIINKFCDLIIQPNKKNFNEIVYYDEIISTFLESPRFRVEEDQRNIINKKIAETLEHILNNCNEILKLKQKIMFLKSIKEKFINSEIKYSSIQQINAKYNISNGFSPSAQKEILNITRNPNRTIITIDDETTLDMDDALSIKKTDDYYVLDVYISDVASYIQEGTYIDMEAKKRYETIYLSDNTIPMFPFELSNNILSLNNDGYKSVICSKIRIDKYGNIMDYTIKPRQILVSKKLNYKDVNTMLELGGPINGCSKDVYETIQNLSELTTILRNKNDSKSNYRTLQDIKTLISGSKLEKNEYSSRTKAEIIVEESMILVNRLPAKILSEKGLPCIYRIHPNPENTENYDKLILLSDIVKMDSKNPDNNSYVKLLKELISMYPKASYSSSNIGHFGLNLDAYSHSSSPIRRYADVALQRIMYDLLFDVPTDEKIKIWDKKINELCEHMNSQSSINESYRSEYEKVKSLTKGSV